MGSGWVCSTEGVLRHPPSELNSSSPGCNKAVMLTIGAVSLCGMPQRQPVAAVHSGRRPLSPPRHRGRRCWRRCGHHRDPLCIRLFNNRQVAPAVLPPDSSPSAAVRAAFRSPESCAVAPSKPIRRQVRNALCKCLMRCAPLWLCLIAPSQHSQIACAPGLVGCEFFWGTGVYFNF